ncbi:SUN domain-containing protein 1-like isoform X2 [Corythoichthys intestinalis]|nr:SUN domain-containing protein 1-like isoform X2 [Corythoichthys intestinalis]XP_057682315.1 SUN domain-containing protein 1-like isoform X2 [Corythoichthys intestinalis]XP_057682316.1 SUN domain-containing protein 1-like isoform X2 [Corythoichthys intestinalis]
MSRCSLRLDDSQPYRSPSYNMGGNGWRNTRMVKHRHSQQLSASCSESLLYPRSHQLSNQSFHSHADASDASLLSSLLHESSIGQTSVQENPALDTWESTVMEEQSAVANSTQISSDCHCPNSIAHTLTEFCREDCERNSESRTANLCSSMEASTINNGHQSLRGATDALPMWSDSLLVGAKRAAACCQSVLASVWQVDSQHGARMGHGGDMKNKQKRLHPNGSLCDDCKEKQHTQQTHDVGSSWSARALMLCCLLWRLTVFSVWCLCRLTSSLWRLTRTMLSSSHVTGEPVMIGGVFKWSKSPMLTRFPLVFVPILLVLIGLFWFGLTGLPGLSVLELRSSVTDIPTLTSHEDLAPKWPIKNLAAAEDSKEEATAASDSARLASMEYSLAALWERVEASGRHAERMQGKLMQKQSGQRHRGERSSLWLSSLVKHHVDTFRRQMDEDRRQREQELFHQRSKTSRLERNLQNLAAQYRLVLQEAKSRQEANAALSTVCDNYSVAVHRRSHDALLSELAQLEAALKDIRRDVDGMLGCQQLDQETILAQVSAQVHKEVRALLYGSNWGDETGFPNSKLSGRYVREADLRASLAELEHNISHHLDQRHSKRALKEVDRKALTRMDVDVMIKNALRLFSHDQTGLADYALESGGGSILSTRCSETYKTKAALISLFGVPLWYFSQSPRVVIQPNVQPGNCWAFQGSRGFLVIQLSMKILPTAFSLEHIPKALAPSGTLRSAPRDFRVYGLDDRTQEQGTLLGSYMYDEDGEALQTFYVTENERAFQVIEVQVHSNWGHQEYTCMYRFRVHGTPIEA